MPIRSQAQWKFLFATKKPFARRWAHETPGSTGKRFDRLPVRVKAPNYSARAGQTIVGNLGRGADGKFTNASGGGGGGDEADRKRPTKAPKAPKAPKRPKLRRRRDETDADYEARVSQAQQARETERAADADTKRQERQTNREAVYAERGLNTDTQSALTALFEGGDNTKAGDLEKLGLAERNRDGTYRLTASGRQFARAAERGDAAVARDTLASAQDRRAAQTERAAARDERKRATAAKRLAKQQERAAKLRAKLSKKKPSGGGRSTPAKAPTPAPKPAAPKPKPKRRARPILVRAPKPTAPRPAIPLQQTKALSVFKDARGRDRWIAVTTNAYQDRDQEWISRGAIAAAVEAGDRSGIRGPLRFWHVPGCDFGDCDYQATAQDGRFLIESGTCYSPRHAAVVKAAAARGYQMSPGFLHSQRTPRGGVFDQIALFERSFVPPGRAANPFTRLHAKDSSDMSLTPEKAAALKALGVDDGLLTSLLQQVEQTDKAAAERATYKSDDAPAWATALLAQVATLVQTTKAAMPPEEMIAAGETEMDDGEAEADTEDELDGELDDAVLDAIADRVVAKLAPLLDIEKKMSGYVEEMKGMMGGYQAKKDDEIAALKAGVNELLGLGTTPQPAGYRPTADVQTLIAAKAAEEIGPGSDGVDPGFFNTFLAFGATRAG